MSGTNVTVQPTTIAPAVTAPAVPHDVDDLALYNAREAVREHDAAQPSGATTTAAPATTTATPPASTPAAPIMVPKGRLDEAVNARRLLEAENVRLRQQALAATKETAPAQTTPAPGQEPPLPVEVQRLGAHVAQVVQAEMTKVLVAAKKFDDSEMTLFEFASEQQRANNVILSMREQYARAVTLAGLPKPQTALSDQVAMQDHIKVLTAQHPWVQMFSDGEFDFLSSIAKQEFAARGLPIKEGNPADTMRLRARVAELSDRYGPDWYPNATPPAAPVVQSAPPATRQTNPTQPASRATPTATRGNAGLAKLALANGHPPTTHKAGAVAAGQDGITLEKLAGMSTEDIANLPPEIRRQFL